MKTPLLLPMLAAALIAGATQAQNPDSFYEKAKQAKAEGRAEEAEDLFRQGKKLEAEHREHADDKGRSTKLENIKREIEESRRAGKYDEAERLERRLGEASGGDVAHRPERFAPDSERMRHVQEAIKHLRVAGLNEPAEHLEQLARRQRPEAEQFERPRRDEQPRQDPMQREMREVQSRLQEMQGQLKKMAGAVEELRAHAKKQDEGSRDRQ